MGSVITFSLPVGMCGKFITFCLNKLLLLNQKLYSIIYFIHKILDIYIFTQFSGHFSSLLMAE